MNLQYGKHPIDHQKLFFFMSTDTTCTIKHIKLRLGDEKMTRAEKERRLFVLCNIYIPKHIEYDQHLIPVWVFCW